MRQIRMRLREVMKGKKLSVCDVQRLLEAIGVHLDRATIYRHMAGNLDFTVIEHYINALDCLLADLLVAEDPPDNEQPKLPMPP